VAQPVGVEGAAKRCPTANGPDVDDFPNAGLSECEGASQGTALRDL
jgi:hypothetical protein